MRIFPPSTVKQGERGTFRVEGIDAKTVQDVIIGTTKPNVRFLIGSIALITAVTASLSNGATVNVQEVYDPTPTTATLSTALTGTENDLVFTSLLDGAEGNAITVAYINPATPSAALGVVVTGTDIVVNLATGVGSRQVETATAAGTVTTSGNATVTVTSAILAGSPLAISVPVVENDTANDIALAIRTALAANGAVAAKFDVSGATNAVILTTKAAYVAANDATLNIAIIDGTSVGVTTAATSANTTAGVVAAITSIASEVAAAVEADEDAAALVSVANKASNDGTGIVTALAETALASGLDWTVKAQIVDSVDLADTDGVGKVQRLTIASTAEAVESENAVLFQITTGATATTQTLDLVVEYSVL